MFHLLITLCIINLNHTDRRKLRKRMNLFWKKRWRVRWRRKKRPLLRRRAVTPQREDKRKRRKRRNLLWQRRRQMRWRRKKRPLLRRSAVAPQRIEWPLTPTCRSALWSPTSPPQRWRWRRRRTSWSGTSTRFTLRGSLPPRSCLSPLHAFYLTSSQRGVVKRKTKLKPKPKLSSISSSSKCSTVRARRTGRTWGRGCKTTENQEWWEVEMTFFFKGQALPLFQCLSFSRSSELSHILNACGKKSLIYCYTTA